MSGNNAVGDEPDIVYDRKIKSARIYSRIIYKIALGFIVSAMLFTSIQVYMSFYEYTESPPTLYRVLTKAFDSPFGIITVLLLCLVSFIPAVNEIMKYIELNRPRVVLDEDTRVSYAATTNSIISSHRSELEAKLAALTDEALTLYREEIKNDILSRSGEVQSSSDAAESPSAYVGTLSTIGEIKVRIGAMSRRCEASAERANSRSSAYLALAIVSSLVGALVATVSYFWFLLYVDPVATDGHSIFLAYRSGLGTICVVAIESVALLFFKYYTKSLELVRYYTGECNNLELRLVSLLMFYDGKENLTKAASVLLRSERNPAFAKGEKTLEMAAMEEERLVLKEMLSTFANLAGSRKAASGKQPARGGGKKTSSPKPEGRTGSQARDSAEDA